MTMVIIKTVMLIIQTIVLVGLIKINTKIKNDRKKDSSSELNR